MPDRPLILFPTPERADRESKTSVVIRTNFPSVNRQFSRLQPTFNVLRTAFEQKAVAIQQSPVGINPDFALVFEIIGTVDSFYTAVQHVEGLEWIFDKESEPFTADEDFYYIDEQGQASDEALNGKLYCVMSNQQAMMQMISLWNRYQNGDDNVFQRGFAGLRDVFTHIKNIRKWGAQDRISETHAVEYWRENLDLDGDSPVPFEIELFFRAKEEARRIASNTINQKINALGGRVLHECILSEIAYHAMLVELPRVAIENLVNQYEDIELSQVDDIMFFRPTCQSVFVSKTDSEPCTVQVPAPEMRNVAPVIAVFDGMPIQNHPLLRNRIIVDDPDEYAIKYESKYRIHGTSMTSLVIYGDLNRNDSPITSPVYVRPILRPKLIGPDSVQECVPNDELFVDILHRAVKRMMEGENGESATAPNTKIINLSIGDPVRQLSTIMSPTARLIDYLAYKYKILFIISAGNHDEILKYVGQSFSNLKALSILDRNNIFGKAIKENQRNLKVLAPAESLNGLTIGALYDDFTNGTESGRFIWAVEKGMPSPISAYGKGYRLTVKPDLFYYGGRKFVREKFDGILEWVLSRHEPGCKVAAPYDDSSGQAYSFGTSDAAAQITHEAAKCYDVLEQVFLSETGGHVPNDYKAILLKAMLTHGASWETIADKVTAATGDSVKKLCKWLGNGIPNIEKVVECTKERITLIGLGELKKEKGDIFRLPLPVDFSTRLLKRKLTVTLAYLSPIAAKKQAYRSAQLWFTIDDGERGLVPNRQNTEWQTVRKGTLQHEIFMGENPIVWDDDDNLVIKVNCKREAGNFREAIPYCLFVSFEVAEGFDVDLYTEVTAKIRQRVQVPNN